MIYWTEEEAFENEINNSKRVKHDFAVVTLLDCHVRELKLFWTMTWLVSAGGYLDHFPVEHRNGFREFLRCLHLQVVNHLLRMSGEINCNLPIQMFFLGRQLVRYLDIRILIGINRRGKHGHLTLSFRGGVINWTGPLIGSSPRIDFSNLCSGKTSLPSSKKLFPWTIIRSGTRIQSVDPFPLMLLVKRSLWSSSIAVPGKNWNLVGNSHPIGNLNREVGIIKGVGFEIIPMNRRTCRWHDWSINYSNCSNQERAMNGRN